MKKFISLLSTILLFSSQCETNIYKRDNLNIHLVKGDILKLDVDAIVNPANRSLKHLGGLCGKIHDAAGVELEKECLQRHPKGIQAGEAIITKGYKLKAKHVVHTPGPDCRIENENKLRKDLLTKSYQNSLKVAEDAKLKSIAFPTISTGIFEFPMEEAAKIAIETALNYKLKTVKDIYFVVFNDKEFLVYKKLLDDSFKAK